MMVAVVVIVVVDVAVVVIVELKAETLWYGLLCFYSISTIVCYLIPSLVYS